MNDYIAKRSGTSFKGYLLTTYEELVATFGQPKTNPDNHKVDAEWIIDTPHGVATIYNYKDGKSYMGDKGLEITQICEWHVGGKSIEPYNWVKKQISDQHIQHIA